MDRMNPERAVVPATRRHAAEISAIYGEVRLDPDVLLDLVDASEERRSAAHRSIRTHGGFLSPEAESDMTLGLERGVTVVAIQDHEVIGFNRYATDPEAVHECLREELLLERADPAASPGVFEDWSGDRERSAYKSLTRVRWLDRDAAGEVVEAARAGLRGEDEGKLAWAIDAAVKPTHRRMGVARSLSTGMRALVRPRGFDYLAYRMFQILGVNGLELDVPNTRSAESFVDPTSTLFAYTEETIRIRDDIVLAVRWNQWLKRYALADGVSRGAG